METSIQEVADHVYQFKVPIPFKLRDINLYLVKDSDGCLLIDTGTNTPATVETLQASLAQLGVTFADLRYVVITHFHSDHAGLAGLIQQHSPAQILMHADGAHFLSAWSDEEGQGPVYMAPDAFFSAARPAGRQSTSVSDYAAALSHADLAVSGDQPRR